MPSLTFNKSRLSVDFKKIIFVLLATVGGFLTFGSVALATTIFSPLLEIEVDPGDNQRGIVKIFNETNEPIHLISSVEAFSASGENGQPVYLPADEKLDYLSWFTIEQEDIILGPQDIAIIPFQVDVPANAVPGGYYSVIFWQEVAPTDELQVNIGSKVGTLIFMKVNGDVTEAGEVAQFGLEPDKKLFFSFPLTFATRFANTGNVHLAPTGSIELRGWFNQKEVLEINSSGRNVLPNSARKFEVVWGSSNSTGHFLERSWRKLQNQLDSFSFGRYSATLNLTYGIDNPKSISQEITFWFIPVYLIAVLLFALLILALIIKLNSKIKKIKNRATKSQNDKT